MTDRYEALEVSLQALEQGRDIDSVLAKYPQFAVELRPLLEAALAARQMGSSSVPAGVGRRGRTRLLQQAVGLRASQEARDARVIPLLPRLAIMLGLAVGLALSSAGLVSAASGTLPGDQLYSLKRTWEQVRLVLAVNSQDRDLLESQFDRERLDEIDGLLGARRSAMVTFSGLIMKQNGNNWVVSNIPVLVTPSTQISINPVADGLPVSVVGFTDPLGVVNAEMIELLPSGVSLPPLEPSNGTSLVDQGGASAPAPALPKGGPQEGLAGNGSPTFEFHGVVNTMQADGTWMINGQSVVVAGAQIKGTIVLGAAVKFQGYYTTDGRFVVTSIGSSYSAVRKRRGERSLNRGRPLQGVITNILTPIPKHMVRTTALAHRWCQSMYAIHSCP